MTGREESVMVATDKGGRSAQGNPGGGPPPDHDAYGMPDHLRRLSHKILAAFNHAYACGETEIAARLRGALVEAERQGRRDRPERRVSTALREASLWVAYVQARNRYLALVEGKSSTPSAQALALEAMQRAYQRWSEV
jgi:hypothetical protein